MFDELKDKIYNDLIGKSNIFHQFYNSLYYSQYLEYKKMTRKTLTPIIADDIDDIKTTDKSMIGTYSKSESGKTISINDFDKGLVIGVGAFGYVRVCCKKDCGKFYAMKEISKKRVMVTDSLLTVMDERNVLGAFKSNYITNLKCCLMDKDKLYIIEDLMIAGDLRNYLNEYKRLDINRCRFYSAQILLALEHVHSKRVIYRDLTPENVLFDTKGNCKLSDFGLSIRFQYKHELEWDIARLLWIGFYKNNNINNTNDIKDIDITNDNYYNRDDDDQCLICILPKDIIGHILRFVGIKYRRAARPTTRGYAGRPGCIAPEIILASPYDFNVDYFAFGVLIYRMLSGNQPFFRRRKHANQQQQRRFNRTDERSNALDRNAIETTPIYSSKYFNDISTNLIKGLLCKNVKFRLGYENGAKEIKKHPWFKQIDFKLLNLGLIEPPFVLDWEQKMGDKWLKQIKNDYDTRKYRDRDVDKRYENVEITSEFETKCQKFPYVSRNLLQDEMIGLLQDVYDSTKINTSVIDSSRQEGIHSITKNRGSTSLNDSDNNVDDVVNDEKTKSNKLCPCIIC